MQINVSNVNSTKKKMKTVSMQYGKLYERMKNKRAELESNWSGNTGAKMQELWNKWMSEVNEEKKKADAIYDLLDSISHIAVEDEADAKKISNKLSNWRI